MCEMWPYHALSSSREGEAGFKPRLKLDVVVEAHPHWPVGAGGWSGKQTCEFGATVYCNTFPHTLYLDLCALCALPEGGLLLPVLCGGSTRANRSCRTNPKRSIVGLATGHPTYIPTTPPLRPRPTLLCGCGLDSCSWGGGFFVPALSCPFLVLWRPHALEGPASAVLAGRAKYKPTGGMCLELGAYGNVQKKVRTLAIALVRAHNLSHQPKTIDRRAGHRPPNVYTHNRS